MFKLDLCWELAPMATQRKAGATIYGRLPGNLPVKVGQLAGRLAIARLFRVFRGDHRRIGGESEDFRGCNRRQFRNRRPTQSVVRGRSPSFRSAS
jgi:hypothetical protein